MEDKDFLIMPKDAEHWPFLKLYIGTSLFHALNDIGRRLYNAEESIAGLEATADNLKQAHMMLSNKLQGR